MENIILNSNYFDFKGIVSCHDYYLIKDFNIYQIILAKNDSEILIKSSNYMTKINSNFFSLLTQKAFDSINAIYNGLINAFDEKTIFIKEIKIKQLIKLLFIIEDREIEIILPYFPYMNNENMNTNIFINEINSLRNEIKILKEENKKLINEIKNLKQNNNDNNKIQKDLKSIQFISNLTKDSFCDDNSDNSFTAFKSIRNLLYIIYSNHFMSIISYCFNSQQKIAVQKMQCF